jgi:hypothetical protein
MSLTTSNGSGQKHPSSRLPILRIVDLLTTTVQSVRIDLLGSHGATVTRLGTVLVYMPLLLVGYLLMLASLMKFVAVVLGWGVTMFLFGVLHLAISAFGMVRGRSVGTSKIFDVVDPDVAPDGAVARSGAFDTRATLQRPLSTAVPRVLVSRPLDRSAQDPASTFSGALR